MSTWNSVAIVGVGLIGGSIGLALRHRRLADRVVGIGRREESLRVAKSRGAVTATTTSLATGVADAELVIVCTPVEQIAEHVRQTAEHCPSGALVTDAGSTKASIVGQLGGDLGRDVRFVGSHPLAGGEKSGPGEADADLFVQRVVVVTPDRHTRPQDREAISQFWTSLGARVVEMSPQAHDSAVATTSHLPHVVAAALAAAVPEENFAISAGGLRDTTRIAAGDVELWTQILLDNREPVLAALDAFDRSLAAFRAALEARDREQLKQALNQAKRKRDALGS
ncbi:MAG: prephenate dehydrogenase/arogenate dehydrogenase family protein [Pirellulales bacterium]|nr:prephenate dehydrogenase/arogenate dehydrogenase family protein [Pirellulales bacterium]